MFHEIFYCDIYTLIIIDCYRFCQSITIDDKFFLWVRLLSITDFNQYQSVIDIDWIDWFPVSISIDWLRLVLMKWFFLTKCPFNKLTVKDIKNNVLGPSNRWPRRLNRGNYLIEVRLTVVKGRILGDVFACKHTVDKIHLSPWSLLRG